MSAWEGEGVGVSVDVKVEVPAAHVESEFVELMFEDEPFESQAFKRLVVAFLDYGGVLDDVTVGGDGEGAWG